MISLLGHACLLLALTCSVGGVVLALLGGRSASGRVCMFGNAVLTTLAAFVLAWALFSDRFELAYVADHSERSLPTLYKLASLWSGQEGSLLLWALLLSVMSAVASRSVLIQRSAVAALACVNTLFSAALLFSADPFSLAADSHLLDGRGLHPLLQHWAMVLHPPILFTGYAASSVPMALMVGALVASGARATSGEELAARLRPWVMICWLALTGGIVLGAWWAYVELGWGGYWAWDPVENASLLPWLTCTALFHSVKVHQRTGRMVGWVCALCAATFLLCMVGTYITRSGIVQSMHAFAAAGVGAYFLGFILFVFAGTGVLFIRRWKLLTGSGVSASGSLREAVVTLANTLLVVMAIATLIGTLAPIASGVLQDKPVGVGAAYYNRFVVPVALIAIALMAVGPLVPNAGNARGQATRDVLGCVLAGVLASALAAAFGVREPMALVCAAICVAGFASIAAGVWQATPSAQGRAMAGRIADAAATIALSHRRYAAKIAHLGVLLVVVGVAASSLFETTRNLTLAPGQSATVGSYTVRLENTRQLRGSNYSAVEARLTLVSPNGQAATISPQRRFYDKADQSGAEVALRTGLLKDAYFVLVGWEAGGSTIALQARIIPMVIWIWIGAAVMLAGGVCCLVPNLATLRRSARVPSLASASVPTERDSLPAAGVLSPAHGATR